MTIHSTDRCKKCRRTLRRIYKEPASRKLQWPEVIALIQGLGQVKRISGGELVFSLKSKSREFSPRPGENDLGASQVADLRDFLECAGIGKKLAPAVLNAHAHIAPYAQKRSAVPPVTSREVRLRSRPNGVPTLANFSVVETTLAPLQDGQVLVRNLFMSVDPYMRGRMNEGKSYVPPFELGQPLDGGAIGEVVESRAKGFSPGDAVASARGWREYFNAVPADLHLVNRKTQPLSLYLGALGMTGLTAWAGLNLVDVKAGDVIYISGAAGAVGNVAGQLAKLRGCRVIGSAGSADKVKILREECGFDAAFDYKAGPVLEQLRAAAPDGIDVYFDNVGGESLEAALSMLCPHGRIVACGAIAKYNDNKPACGPSNLANMVGKRLTMKGLIVTDSLPLRSKFEKEIGGYIRAGKLKNEETVVQGIDHAVDAFLGLFSGQNLGKMIVQLAPTGDD